MVEGGTATLSFLPPTLLSSQASQTQVDATFAPCDLASSFELQLHVLRRKSPFSSLLFQRTLAPAACLASCFSLPIVASKMQIDTNFTSPSSTDEPTRKILAQQDMEGWQRSEAFFRIDDFIQTLRGAAEGKGAKEEKEPSQVRYLFFSIPTAFDSS
jgi:hypothetical protein